MVPGNTWDKYFLGSLPACAFRAYSGFDANRISQLPTAPATLTFVPDLKLIDSPARSQITEDVIESNHRRSTNTDARLRTGCKRPGIPVPAEASEEAVITGVIATGQHLHEEDGRSLFRLVLRSSYLVGEPGAGLQALAGENGLASGHEVESGGV